MGKKVKCKENKKKAPNKPIFIIVPLILLVLAISGIFAFTTVNGQINDEQIVATVDGEPICAREFIQRLNYNHKAQTINYFKNQYGITEEKDFWKKSFNGEIPSNVAKKHALDTCISIKVQEILLKDKKLLDDISYSKFLKDLKKENERRKKAVENNQVIYGPITYGENEYFIYTFSNLILKLKEKLYEKELKATEDELLRVYETKKDELYKKPDIIKTEKISISFSSLNKEDAKKQIELVKSEISKGKDFYELAKQYSIDGKVIEQTFDESTARTDSRFNEEFKLEILKLNKGNISNVIEEKDVFSIVKCVDKKDTGFYSFEEVKDNVKIKYLDEKYDEFIKSKVSQAKIEINQETLEKIKVE